MTFDDGEVKIYQITNIAAPGAKPKEALGEYETHCFRIEAVGITRYYEALKADQMISDVISIPDWHNIRPDAQIAVMEDGSQYRIRQVQRTYDGDGMRKYNPMGVSFNEGLKITRLSLERVGNIYAFMS